MAPTLDEHGLSEAHDVFVADCIPVETARELRCLCAEILARRGRPVVALTLGEDGVHPVHACSEVRALVGPGVHIYLIRDDDLLYRMRELLGGSLTIDRGAVRVWWPGANAHCDPGDHPAVLALEGEPLRVLLEELAQQLDLTRPRVRGHIRLIEDARAFLEHELARARAQNDGAHARLRDTQIECHGLRARAEAAEARLAANEHPPGLDRS
jgi:hypothetical protein